MPAARQIVVQSFSGQIAQRFAHALQFGPHAVHLNFRRGEIARQCAGNFAGSRLAAARHFPPENGMAEMFQPLRDGGKIVADRAGAANQQIRFWKMFAVLKGRQHRAHRTKRGVNAHRFGLLQQLVAAFHEARRPPRAVGIKCPHARQRIGHDRHGAEVFHRADDFVAAGAGLMQPLVFRQQKIPEPQRGGRVVELQMLQPEIFFAAPRAAAAARHKPVRAGRRGAVVRSVHPTRTKFNLRGAGCSFQSFQEKPGGGLARAALAGGLVGFEQQNRQAESFPQGLRLGAPEIAAGEMPEHDAAHLARHQPRLQPGIKPACLAVETRPRCFRNSRGRARRTDSRASRQIQTPDTNCARRFRWRSARRVRRRPRSRRTNSDAARTTARRRARAERAADFPAAVKTGRGIVPRFATNAVRPAELRQTRG